MKETIINSKNIKPQNLFFIGLYNTLTIGEDNVESKYITYQHRNYIITHIDDEISNLLLSLEVKNYYKAVTLIYNKYFSNKNIENDTLYYEFDGSGDSGDVYESNIEECLDIKSNNYYLFDSISDLIQFDWYNNEGGQGILSINLKTGIIDVSGGYRVTTITDASETFIL